MFGNKQKKLRKSARNLIGHANKVIAYRRDVLEKFALEQIHSEKDALEAKLKSDSTDKQIDSGINELDKTLRKHGGKIYPVTFASENVEMVLVAVILAIGIRTFFFQPFKIPTNSMWPTYAGLNPTVYSPEEPRPSLAKRAFLGVTQGLPQSLPFGLLGHFNYYVEAPTSGELIIPVTVANSDIGMVVMPIAEAYETGIIGKIGKSIKKKFKLLVGNQIVDIDVPGDFVIDDVYLQSWFPEYDSLEDLYRDFEAKGMVESGREPMQRFIKTGIMFEPGQAILSFDINSGDMLFVDRFSYNFVKPDVGDPIVFRTDNIPGLRSSRDGILYPDERYYIKRLVGVPGDVLEIQETTLMRNGEPIEGADAFDLNAQVTEGYAGYQPRWKLITGETETIPEGYLFAMGDNSPDSYDSRGWGFAEQVYISKLTPEEEAANVPPNMVPEKDVVGRAAFIFYPFTKRWGPAE